MKITMYELYGKIYDKKPPKHIKVYDEDWYWNDYDGYVTKESLKTTPDAQIYLMDRYRTFMNLDKEVEIIEEPKNMEKWYLIYQYHDDHIVEFDDEDSLNDYLNTLKDTYKYDSDFKYKIIQGREMVE